jgi:hypothetical protein
MIPEENEEPTREEVLDVILDAEYLASLGHEITPKGCIATSLMLELKMGLDEANELATKIDNRIFLADWIYVRSGQLDMRDDG